jgi:hypothetical protein
MPSMRVMPSRQSSLCTYDPIHSLFSIVGTHGDLFEGHARDMNVEGSKHYFFAIDKEIEKESSTWNHADEGGNECFVCGLSFESKAALQAHREAPALPDPSVVDVTTLTTEKSKAGNLATGDTRLETAPDLVQFHVASTAANSPSVDKHSDMNWEVTHTHNGKRLRRFLQHVAFPKLARKQCDKLVTDGMILVNGSVAVDRSRILKEKDVVALVNGEGEKRSKSSGEGSAPQVEISIVARYPPLNGDSPGTAGSAVTRDCILVVDKPVGVRTKGIYESARTVEQVVSRRMEARFESLSSMDTGIRGLCVMRLANVGNNILRDVRVQSEFTVLVHGHVPTEWNEGSPAEVPILSIRKFDRKITKLDFQHGSDAANELMSDPNMTMEEKDTERVCDHRMEGSSCSEHQSWTMRITCVERTCLKRRQHDDKAAPAMSTIKISTSCTASGLCRAIILYLRKRRYPVVGDRLCQREYQSLPRSFRNRLKKRLMIGCFSVELLSLNENDAGVSSTSSIQGKSAREETICQEDLFDKLSDNHSFHCRLDIPEKFSAAYWQQFFLHPSPTPPEP